MLIWGQYTVQRGGDSMQIVEEEGCNNERALKIQDLSSNVKRKLAARLRTPKTQLSARKATNWC